MCAVLDVIGWHSEEQNQTDGSDVTCTFSLCVVDSAHAWRDEQPLPS